MHDQAVVARMKGGDDRSRDRLETMSVMAIVLLGVAFVWNFVRSAVAGVGTADPFAPGVFLVGALEAMVVVALLVSIATLILDQVDPWRRHG